MRCLFLALMLALISPLPVSAQQEYLYFRDVKVPPFQKLHEFFDLPDRPGSYEVTMVSEALGPLTFHVLRVRDEVETTVSKKRSYKLGNHEFHAPFRNPGGDDLIVEVANSNPAAVAKVSVYVVELEH